MDKRTLILLAGLGIIFLFFSPHPVPVPNPSSVLPTDQTTYLVIEKLSLRVPVVEVTSNDEPTVQTALERGVVHLANTAGSGEIGNYYIVGHSSDYPWIISDYTKVFARLPELLPGDLINIETGGVSWIYQVQQTKIVEPNDLSVLSQDTSGKKFLTLQTSYPIGTAKQRFLVIAQLRQK